MADRRLSVKDAAEQAGCSKETIRRYIRSGELPATRHPVRHGRPFEVTVTDLAAFLAARRAESSASAVKVT